MDEPIKIWDYSGKWFTGNRFYMIYTYNYKYPKGTY